VIGRRHQVVVVVPVDRDIDEAEDVAEEHRDELGVDDIAERRDVTSREPRHAKLQHHDRDDDG